MTATYPSSVRQLTPKIDIQDTVLADHVNVLQEEIRAIETALGAASTSNSILVSSYSGSFSQSTNWSTLGDRLLNIEAGLISGTGTSSSYVSKTGDSIIPAVGKAGLAINARSGNLLNLFETKDSASALGFNVDYTGKPKYGTYAVLYVGSSEYTSLQNATSAAATAAATAQATASVANISPFLLAGM
jgi:hypothetical protein